MSLIREFFDVLKNARPTNGHANSMVQYVAVSALGFVALVLVSIKFDGTKGAWVAAAVVGGGLLFAIAMVLYHFRIAKRVHWADNLDTKSSDLTSRSRPTR